MLLSSYVSRRCCYQSFVFFACFAIVCAIVFLRHLRHVSIDTLCFVCATRLAPCRYHIIITTTYPCCCRYDAACCRACELISRRCRAAFIFTPLSLRAWRLSASAPCHHAPFTRRAYVAMSPLDTMRAMLRTLSRHTIKNNDARCFAAIERTRIEREKCGAQKMFAPRASLLIRCHALRHRFAIFLRRRQHHAAAAATDRDATPRRKTPSSLSGGGRFRHYFFSSIATPLTPLMICFSLPQSRHAALRPCAMRAECAALFTIDYNMQRLRLMRYIMSDAFESESAQFERVTGRDAARRRAYDIMMPCRYAMPLMLFRRVTPPALRCFATRLIHCR